MNELLLRRRLMLAAKGDIPIDYLKFIALTDNGIIGLANRSTNQYVFEYSTGGTVWDNFTTGVTVTLNSGDTVYVRGKLTGNNDTSNYTQFKTTSGTFSVSGNINSLWNYEDLEQALYEYCGYGLFSGCTGLVGADELVLPATNLSGASGCYSNMFEGCSSLVTAPKLPATELEYECYGKMFAKCTNLTNVPDLPAIELAGGCYLGMFFKCESLSGVPSDLLPATKLADNCYYGMLQTCTNLLNAPELPATKLADSCYEQMFAYCSNLKDVPNLLPATALTNECYANMFHSCSSLTTAPELPATELVDYCYYGMFNKCNTLTYIKCLATNISASNCTTNWVNGVASTGTFVKAANMAGWTTGVNGIPTGWTVK